MFTLHMQNMKKKKHSDRKYLESMEENVNIAKSY